MDNKKIRIIFVLSKTINKMKNQNFKIGQRVNYQNGNPSIYNGQIVKIKEHTIVVVDCAAGMELWNAGYSVGSEISPLQIIERSKSNEL